MITLITGLPGAGKTAALVAMLQGELSGRSVYVSGIPELKLPHLELEDPREWMSLPDGCTIVVDECQRFWRPRGAGAKVPPEIEALETHRHRGMDIVLLTQDAKLLDVNIRRLVGRHIHLRDLGILGRRWYESSEVFDDYRKAMHSTKYVVDKRTFAAYKSASVHVKPIRSVPRALLVAGFAGVGVIGLAGWLAFSLSARGKPADTAEGPARAASAAPVGVTVGGLRVAEPAQEQEAFPAPLKTSQRVKDREPYEGFEVAVAGQVVVSGKPRFYFSLSRDGFAVATITDQDLYAAGYSWRNLGPCVGVLIFGEGERVVRCDVRERKGVGSAQEPKLAAPASADKEAFSPTPIGR